MNPPDTTGWRERFLNRFYIYNLETKSPAGADKEAVAFIEKEITEARKAALIEARDILEANNFVAEYVVAIQALIDRDVTR